MRRRCTSQRRDPGSHGSSPAEDVCQFHRATHRDQPTEFAEFARPDMCREVERPHQSFGGRSARLRKALACSSGASSMSSSRAAGPL